MNSLIYKGTVSHHRLRPRDHRFVYPLYYYAFDLDELEQLEQRFWFFGYNRVRLISVHDKDYLFAGEGSIKQKLLHSLSEKPYADKIRRVVLVTSARYCNYVFNPVSFFYCYDAQGKLLAIVAEVNNTFGERHPYILDQELGKSNGAAYGYRARKAFHVSPFNDMKGEYDFRFSDINDRLNIGIDMIRENELTLKAGLSGEGMEFTGGNALRTVAKYPLSVFLTMPRICWEAARLYFKKRLSVYSKPIPESADTLCVGQPTLTQRFARRLVLKILGNAAVGRLKVRMPDGRILFFGSSKGDSCPTLHIKTPEFFTKLVLSTDIGFGEAFTERLWETDDLTGLIQFFIANEEAIFSNQPVFSLTGKVFNRLIHLSRKNTISGSRQNISAHYDLNNDLFKCFLDDTMTYSAAAFTHENQSLAEAQKSKLKKLIDKAEISENDHVLEIGCGWGSFAIAAAKETGCRVTGVTLSEEQLSFARERVREEGLEDRIKLELCDYRDIKGSFDRIVSIEMLEAVGHENMGTFFESCDRLLKPGGKAVLQVITILDERYETYRKSCDWIQKYIFPGGCLPSLGRLSEVISKHSTFEFKHVETMGGDYAKTLRTWRSRFNAAKEHILELGFDQRFIRIWNYYFSYCEAGFLSGPINTLQFVLARPAFKDSSRGEI